MNEVFIVENRNRRPPKGDLICLSDGVFRAISRADLKGNSFLDCCLELIPCHILIVNDACHAPIGKNKWTENWLVRMRLIPCNPRV